MSTMSLVSKSSSYSSLVRFTHIGPAMSPSTGSHILGFQTERSNVSSEGLIEPVSCIAEGISDITSAELKTFEGFIKAGSSILSISMSLLMPGILQISRSLVS